MEEPLIVITGGGRGIGAAIAKAFAQNGVCRLALVARSEDQLVATKEACEALGADAKVYPCDVGDATAVKGMAREIEDDLGAPDCLINNAGFFLGKSFLETTTEDFDTVVAANLRSCFLVSKAFASDMVRRKNGTVINICSVASRDIFPGMSAYSAAKYGMLGLSRVMREELLPHNVRVIAVMPGATLTNAWDGSELSEDDKQEKLMPADDVARAVLDAWKLPQQTVVDELWLRPITGHI